MPDPQSQVFTGSLMTSSDYHPPRPHQEEVSCCGYPTSQKCSDTISSILSTLGILFLVLTYTVLGALTFMSLESVPPSTDTPLSPTHNRLSATPNKTLTTPTPSVVTPSKEDKMRSQTVQKLWKITEELNILYKENWTKLAEVEMVKFERDLIRRYNLYSNGGAGGIDGTHEWNFSNSFLYSLTLITTIGYGSVSAKTLWGRITTILYTLIGIPLMLIYLSIIGEALANNFRSFYGKLTKQTNRQNKSKQQNSLPNIYTQFNHVNDMNTKYDPGIYRNGSSTYCTHELRVRIPILVSFFIIISFILLGSLIFNKLENWTFLDGTFFCFTSLGTIGFGELIPGGSASLRGKNISVLVSSTYILIGMALISMSFNLIQEELIIIIKKFTMKLNKSAASRGVCDKNCDIS
uniref:TWiK family of potassium channels protein 7 n=1 Tax=Cacopsylla melanoneura TaxID=428564 RepID=A0A8D8WM85_9HEMI